MIINGTSLSIEWPDDGNYALETPLPVSVVNQKIVEACPQAAGIKFFLLRDGCPVERETVIDSLGLFTFRSACENYEVKVWVVPEVEV